MRSRSCSRVVSRADGSGGRAGVAPFDLGNHSGHQGKAGEQHEPDDDHRGQQAETDYDGEHQEGDDPNGTVENR